MKTQNAQFFYFLPRVKSFLIYIWCCSRVLSLNTRTSKSIVFFELLLITNRSCVTSTFLEYTYKSSFFELLSCGIAQSQFSVFTLRAVIIYRSCVTITFLDYSCKVFINNHYFVKLTSCNIESFS